MKIVKKALYSTLMLACATMITSAQAQTTTEATTTTKPSAVLFKIHEIKPVVNTEGVVTNCDFMVTFYNRTTKGLRPAKIEMGWTDNVSNRYEIGAEYKETTKVEEKINASLTKLGLTGDQISFTFNADNTYSATIKGRLVQGTYALDVENNKITLTYLNGLGTITPQISKTGNTLSLLYDADKLLKFLTSISAVSNNSTLTTLNALLKSYDGMLIGMELQK